MLHIIQVDYSYCTVNILNEIMVVGTVKTIVINILNADPPELIMYDFNAITYWLDFNSCSFIVVPLIVYEVVLSI